MYYVIPAKAANAALAKKFIDFAESPEIQAEGIVKQFNWYPGIDPQHVQAKLDAGDWNKLFTDISPDGPREATAGRSRCPILHRHRRGVRARSSTEASGASPVLRRALASGRRRDRLDASALVAAGAGRRRRCSRSSSLFFVSAARRSRSVLGVRAKDGGFTLEHFAKALRALPHRLCLHDLRSSCCRRPDRRSSRSPSPAT